MWFNPSFTEPLQYPGYCTTRCFQKRAPLARGPDARLQRSSAPVLQVPVQMLPPPGSFLGSPTPKLDETPLPGSCGFLGSHIPALPTLGRHLLHGFTIESPALPNIDRTQRRRVDVDGIMENKTQSHTLTSPDYFEGTGEKGAAEPPTPTLLASDISQWFWICHTL